MTSEGVSSGMGTGVTGVLTFLLGGAGALLLLREEAFELSESIEPELTVERLDCDWKSPDSFEFDKFDIEIDLEGVEVNGPGLKRGEVLAMLHVMTTKEKGLTHWKTFAEGAAGPSSSWAPPWWVGQAWRRLRRLPNEEQTSTRSEWRGEG